MQATEERLSSLDATFLELEQADDGALMHTGGALIFDPLESETTPSLEQILELLDERVGLLPRFRCRLSEPRVHGLRRPVWVADPGFDLRAHVRHAALPAGRADAELHEWRATSGRTGLTAPDLCGRWRSLTGSSEGAGCW